MGEEFFAYLDQDPAVALVVPDVVVVSLLAVEVGLFLSFPLLWFIAVFDQDLKSLFLEAFLLDNVFLPHLEIGHDNFQILLLGLHLEFDYVHSHDHPSEDKEHFIHFCLGLIHHEYITYQGGDVLFLDSHECL